MGAEMNRKGYWKAQIALGVVCAVLTFAIAIQIPSVNQNTKSEVNKTSQRIEELQLELGKEIKNNKDLTEQYQLAQSELAQYRESAANNSDAAKVMLEQLTRSEMLSGLTAVEGAGIIVTIADSTAEQMPGETIAEKEMLIIHDSDLRMTISELAAAGAEAYSINGERIISTTPIRCVGPVITVNEKKMAPPYVITVIGDPKTLEAAVNMRGGLKDMFESVGNICTVSTHERLVVPAYNRAIKFDYAKPVTSVNGDGDITSRGGDGE